MKKITLLLVLSITLFSCSNDSSSLLDGAILTNVKFVVKTQGNHNAKISTVFVESGNFKLDDTFNVNKFPFTKEYSGRGVNNAASTLLKYEDKSANIASSYSVTLQVFQNDILLEEKVFVISQLVKQASISPAFVVSNVIR